jgi:hypothetical protein
MHLVLLSALRRFAAPHRDAGAKALAGAEADVILST